MIAPPRLAAWLLTRALPSGARRDTILGDLLEEFLARASHRSSAAARRWYWRQAIGLVCRALVSRSRDPGAAPLGWIQRLDSIAVDARAALRSLAHARGFSAACLLILALGLGATTAAFSVVQAVLLRPLPFAGPDRLMWMTEVFSTNGQNMSVAWPDFEDWRRQLTSFDEIAAVHFATFNLTGTDRPARLGAREVTSNLFHLLGVQPALGRMFTADEDRPGAPPLIVITDAFWHEYFGGDPRVLGRRLTLDGESREVIGVLPAGFRFNPLTSEAFYSSLGRTATADTGLTDRGNHNGLGTVGRLRPGVSEAAARAELDALAASLRKMYPNTNATVGAQLMPLTDRLVNGVGPTLATLFGAVAILLLLGAVNVASLLVARSLSRRHELAVRAALGCSRGRLIRQLFVESAVVALAGGACGLAVADGLLRVLIAAAPPGVPRLDEVRMDASVWLFALGASAAVALILAVFPAVHAAGIAGQQALVRSDRAGAASGSAQRLRRALMAVEVALAVVLLAGAGLMVRTMRALTTVETGFDPANVLTARFVIAPDGDRSDPAVANRFEARLNDFYERAQSRLRALPGIVDAGFARSIPIEGSQWGSVFIVGGRPVPRRADLPSAAMIPATPGYFTAFRIPLRAGRLIGDADSARSQPVAVVNETFARHFWPNESAVGKQFKQGWPEDSSPWRTIVGVVGDVTLEGVDVAPPMQVFMPMPQRPSQAAYVVVRTAPALAAGTAGSSIRAALRDVAPDLPLDAIRSMDEMMSGAVARQRLTMLILSGLAALALVLSCVGLSGVVTHAVSARVPEIGVRLALGATARQITHLFVGQGLATTLVGLGVGTAASLGLADVIARDGLLFRVTPTDPTTFWTAGTALLVVSLAACYIPARRAARVNPVVTLRGE